MSLVDMRIDVDDFPRVSVGHRRSSSLPFSPFMIIDGRARNSSFSYSKLPEQPIRLSVLKLDGSCFEIEVLKSATVGELRSAVEAVFSHIPRKGPGKISWPHVWGHFCLMYAGHKLVTETDCIRDYGIRDGDQLQFIRHLSTTYSLGKKRSTKQVAASEKHRISLSRLDSIEDERLINKGEDHYDDIENGRFQHYYDYRDEDCFQDRQSKWKLLLKRWFPYSRLSTMERMRSLKGSPPSRSSCGLFGCFRRKVIQFCGDNRHLPRDMWRED